MAKNALVKKLEQKGRGPDTILAHITPEEAQLLEAHGGSGTINPETGLPEFLPDWITGLWDKFTGFVRQYAPVIMPAVAIFAPTLIPSIGTWLGATTATGAAVLGSAALSAGVTLAAGGSLKDVLTSAALAGATTYLTPVLGQKIAGAVGVASPVAAQLIGTAATSGGLAALRGGTVKQVIAAAATGAASSYLAGVARDAFAGINNGMASGKISANVTQKGAQDSVYVAADAANLKAAGLNESQVVQALKDSGVNGISAEIAAKGTFQGSTAADVAANVAASMPSGSYSGDPAAKSITAGNNLDLLQRIEDSQTIGQDAAQLKAQGLSQAQIKENLMATGVSESAANLAAQRAVGGGNAASIASEIQNYYKTTPIYSNTENVVSRDLGQAMTAEQQDAWRAQPYKAEVAAGKLTNSEAAILSQNGYTPADVTKLTGLGYTGSDLVDLASTGVTASTLTGLGDTKFAETNINDMLKAGASINDISYANRLVGAGTISADNAQKLLMKDLTGTQIYNVASKGDAVVNKIINSNLNSASIDKLMNYGYDLSKAADAAAKGVDINGIISKSNGSTSWLSEVNTAINNATAVAPAPATPGAPVTTGPVMPTEVAPHYTAGTTAADIDFAIADAQQLKAQGLNGTQISSVLKASGMNTTMATYLGTEVARNTSIAYLKSDLNSFTNHGSTPVYGKAPESTTPAPAPTPAPSGPTIPVKMPDGTVGTYDPATGDVHDAGGTKIVSGTEPTPGTGTNVAGPYRVDVSGLIADDNMSPTVRAQHLKGAIPDGTVLANADTPGAYIDQASNAWVVKSGPTEITKPITPVDITPGSRDVVPVDVTPVAPAPVAPTEPPPTTTPSGPGNVVAPPGTEVVYDELGNTYFFNHNTGEILDNSGKVIYTPPVETPAPPQAPAPTPAPTPAPQTPVPPPGQQLVSDETGKSYFFDPATGVITDTDGKPVYTPPTEPTQPTQPVTPAEPPVAPPPAYTPPSTYVPVTGDDGKSYFFDPDTGKVVDTDGKTIYTPPETPAPPTTEPPTTPTQPTGPTTPTTPVGPVAPPVVEPPVTPPQPPVTPPVVEPPVTPPPVEPPLKPLEPVEVPPTKPIPTVEVPTEPPVTPEPPPVLPPVIPPTPVVPTTPTTKVWDPVSVTFKTLPLLPNPGLNPGFVVAQQQYQPTSPVQSQYYWGQHPYQSGGADRMTFDPALYKQVPAPVVPWGLQELYTPTNIAQYLASLQGPVKP